MYAQRAMPCDRLLNPWRTYQNPTSTPSIG
jgi:hypothetical protein